MFFAYTIGVSPLALLSSHLLALALALAPSLSLSRSLALTLWLSHARSRALPLSLSDSLSRSHSLALGPSRPRLRTNFSCCGKGAAQKTGRQSLETRAEHFISADTRHACHSILSPPNINVDTQYLYPNIFLIVRSGSR